jgi:hypothetical protein
MVVNIDAHGQPSIAAFVSSQAYESQIAPCAPASDLRDAQRASLPRETVLHPPQSFTLDAVVTALDENGRAGCARIYPVVIDQALEIPPLPDGKTGWGWTVKRNDPFYFTASIPRQGVAAVRVTGWRGVRPAVFKVESITGGRRRDTQSP